MDEETVVGEDGGPDAGAFRGNGSLILGIGKAIRRLGIVVDMPGNS